MSPVSNAWPVLGYEPELCLTLRLWTQVVGKIRLAKTPWINHSWHVRLYPTARGLTTSPIHDGGRTLQLDFDFVEHALVARSAEGGERRVALEPRTVADFYAAVLAAVRALGFDVELDEHPSELPDG